MDVSIVGRGKTVRYADDNFANMFEFSTAWDGARECSYLWANRIISTSTAENDAQAFEKAFKAASEYQGARYTAHYLNPLAADIRAALVVGA